MIRQDTKDLIDKLLLEKIPMAGIARVTGVSERWLQTYVKALVRWYFQASRCLAEKKGRLTVQCDEMWSFVSNKGNKQWIWLALDIRTREIVGVFVGDRSDAGAQGLWH